MAATCPICNKQSAKEFKPFCSMRCKNIDLGKWLTGSYAVPALETDDLPGIDEESSEDSPKNN